jgi:hypothetical protein
VVLSTEIKAPALCAASANMRMSQISMVGLEGVSSHNNFAPSSSFPWALPAVGASRAVMPNEARNSRVKIRVV